MRDWQPFGVLGMNLLIMHVLRDPVVTLEEVRLTGVSLATLDLDVAIRVVNPNPLGITLRELPFTVLCSSDHRDQVIANGNTGRVKIPSGKTTVLDIPITSQNAALISALATFITRGSIPVTIQGTATIDCILFGWSIPFSKTLPLTVAQVADSLAGKKP
jgi:LEA14-like dessication related protein